MSLFDLAAEDREVLGLYEIPLYIKGKPGGALGGLYTRYFWSDIIQ